MKFSLKISLFQVGTGSVDPFHIRQVRFATSEVLLQTKLSKLHEIVAMGRNSGHLDVANHSMGTQQNKHKQRMGFFTAFPHEEVGNALKARGFPLFPGLCFFICLSTIQSNDSTRPKMELVGTRTSHRGKPDIFLSCAKPTPESIFGDVPDLNITKAILDGKIRSKWKKLRPSSRC